MEREWSGNEVKWEGEKCSRESGAHGEKKWQGGERSRRGKTENWGEDRGKSRRKHRIEGGGKLG